MEREGFVFTACNSILFFPGAVERSSTGCHVAHTKAQYAGGALGRAGVLPSGFSPFTSASFGTDQLAEEPCGFWILRACNGTSPLSPS